MPKKQPTTIEECNAELERTQKLLQQESIVPELKTMTEDEGKDFLYHIAKSMEAQEYLKKRAEGVEAG